MVEIIVISIVIICCIGFSYLLVKLPIWICKIRAIRAGVFNITSSQIATLIRMNCVDKKFFSKYSEFLILNINIDIIELANHLSQGGNLENLYAGAKFASMNNISINIFTLMNWDLAGKNITETLKNGSKKSF